MGFLRTNDLSEVKNGELNLDFKVWVKTGEIGCSLTETKKKKKCKIEPLEVSGHWFRVLRQLTCHIVISRTGSSFTFKT